MTTAAARPRRVMIVVLRRVIAGRLLRAIAAPKIVDPRRVTIVVLRRVIAGRLLRAIAGPEIVDPRRVMIAGRPRATTVVLRAMIAGLAVPPTAVPVAADMAAGGRDIVLLAGDMATARRTIPRWNRSIARITSSNVAPASSPNVSDARRKRPGATICAKN